MFPLLMVIALGYFIYRFASDLLKFQDTWGAAQYGELVLLIVAVPVFVFAVIRAFKKNKVDQVKRQEEIEKQQAALKDTKRRFYLEDDDVNTLNLKNTLGEYYEEEEENESEDTEFSDTVNYILESHETVDYALENPGVGSEIVLEAEVIENEE